MPASLKQQIQSALGEKYDPDAGYRLVKPKSVSYWESYGYSAVGTLDEDRDGTTDMIIMQENTK